MNIIYKELNLQALRKKQIACRCQPLFTFHYYYYIILSVGPVDGLNPHGSPRII